MKRISSLIFLAVVPALLAARAADGAGAGGYRFYPAGSAPASLNSITFDGTNFWTVGDSASGKPTVLRSVNQSNGPGVPALAFSPVTVSGAGSSNLTAVISQGPFLFVGSGAGELTASSGVLFRGPLNPSSSNLALSRIPEGSSPNLGRITDLSLAGGNLVRLGNRFAIGYYPLTTLESTNPAVAVGTAGVSPFFEDYEKSVLIGGNLFFAGSFIGGTFPQGVLSLSRDGGANNAPVSGVAFFATTNATRFLTLETDGGSLYASGTNKAGTGFVAVIEGASSLTTLPPATNSAWKTAFGTPISAVAAATYQGTTSLFVADANGIHARKPGAAFIAGPVSNYLSSAAKIVALSVATNGPLQDLVVGVGGATSNNIVVGGPVPDAPVVGYQYDHYFDSEGPFLVQVTNLVGAASTTARSIAYDFYKAGASAPFATVGPLRDATAPTNLDLSAQPVSVFNYGTNLFQVVARDVRTGITNGPVSHTVFRWPNPQAAQLSRTEGTAESDHYFQAGFGYAGLTSHLFTNNDQFISVTTGAAASTAAPNDVLVHIGLANWYQLNTPVGQSIFGTNVLQPASTILPASTQLAALADRLPLPANLPAGVYTFAAQSVAQFPAAGGLTTNSLATNVTLFNVVVLAPPAAPTVSFTRWEASVCQTNVINRLLPSVDGDWTNAIANPPVLGSDPQLTANISSANWIGVASGAVAAILPLTTPGTSIYNVQSISTNRDGGSSQSVPQTAVAVITHARPLPPGFDAGQVSIGVAGVPTPTPITVASAGSRLISVGESVVLAVTNTPTTALENVAGFTFVEWSLTPSSGAVTSQAGSSNLFAVPFVLGTPTPGLYTLSARSRNYYTNTETLLSEGLPAVNVVRADCPSLQVTTLQVEVRRRPVAPALTASQVGVYDGCNIVYQSRNDTSRIVIGEDAALPLYAATPRTLPGVDGFGGSTSVTADWYLSGPGGVPVTNTPALALNAATFTPPAAIVAATGSLPTTNTFLAFARTVDGAVSVSATPFTLVVTPRPAAPDLTASDYFLYEGGILTQVTNAVPATNGSSLTVADSLAGFGPVRPVYSMTAQDFSPFAVVADWYSVLPGTNILLSCGTSTFQPTTIPLGTNQTPATNQFLAVARSPQGSQSTSNTLFTLIVTPVPLSPAVTASNVTVYSAAGVLTNAVQPVADGSTVVIADQVQDRVESPITRPRPQFWASFPAGDGVTADWYAIQAGVTNQVATNSLSYQPALADSAAGTNTYFVIGRSTEGGSSLPTTFQLVVTPPPAAPQLSASGFYLYQGGALNGQANVGAPDGSTITVADSLVGFGSIRPRYSMAAQVDATNADWYRVLPGTNVLVLKNSATFQPTTAQAPVGTNTFFAVARSFEGGSSTNFPTVTLVVTPIPAAPLLSIEGFYTFVDGKLVFQDRQSLGSGNTNFVADTTGDPANVRPLYSMTAVTDSVVSDWYAVVSGTNQLLLANSATFRPSTNQAPVGTNHYFAVARSVEGASSATPTAFTLVVTPDPAAPGVSIESFYTYDGGVLTLHSKQELGGGGTNVIADDVGDAAHRRPLYSITPTPDAPTADWYAVLPGTNVLVSANSAQFSPTTGQAPIGVTHFLVFARSLEGGTSDQGTPFTLVVTPPPAAPTLSAAGFYSYQNGSLVAQTNVAAPDGSIITVADSLVGLGSIRPVYSMAAQPDATNADWYLVLPGTNVLVLKNSPSFQPTAAQAPVGTNLFFAVARSFEGGSSTSHPTFTLVVTPVPAAPVVSIEAFYTFADGKLTLQSRQALGSGGTNFVADTTGDPANARPLYSMTAVTDSTVSDWYAVVSGTNQLLLANSPTFRPSTNQAPVGTNHYFAVARSFEGASSATPTRFTLVVTPAPAAPLVSIESFYTFGGGALTLQAKQELGAGGTNVVADDVGDAVHRRPVYTITPTLDAPTADWYVVSGGTNVLVSTNSAQFSPTTAQAPVGVTHFLAFARSLEGGTSPQGSAFTLVVTGPPPTPAVTGNLPSVSADGLTVTQTARPVVANESDDVGSQIAPITLQVGPAAGLANAFTRWSVNGALKATAASLTPVLSVGTNTVSLQTFSPEGEAGTPFSVTITVHPAPAAPVVSSPSITVGECNPNATFTASAPGAASILWTAGAAVNSARLTNGASFTPSGAVGVGVHNYFVWAVSPFGDFSLTATTVTLTVKAAPPAAVISSAGFTNSGTAYFYATAIPAGAATNYPALTVSNADADVTVQWWLAGTNTGSAGATFTPTPVLLPTTNDWSVPVAGPAFTTLMRTNTLQVVMIRQGCTNGSTTVSFVVADMPTLQVTQTVTEQTVFDLFFATAQNVDGLTNQLFSSTNALSLSPLTGTGKPGAFGSPASTNGIWRLYHLETINTATNADGFFRIQVGQ